MKRPRGHLLDGSIHPLDLPIGPGMVGFGEAMLDAVLKADTVELVVLVPAFFANCTPLYVSTVWAR